MPIFYAAFLSLAMIGSVSAQTMYRCGNTFSQQPCGHDAKAIDITPVVAKLPKDVLPAPEVIERNKGLCEQVVRMRMKDPEGARITEMKRVGVRSFNLPNTPTGVAYLLSVNGKNSYGGYTGETPKVCIFSLDETKFLQMLGD